MNQLSNLDRLLEVQAMTRIFDHDNVVVCHFWEASVVERRVVKDLSLKRDGTIEHETATFESLVEFWKAIYVLLILIDRRQIHLKRPIRVEIKKKRRLEYLILHFSFDLFDRVF